MQNDLVVNRLFPASIKTIAGTQWGYINNRGKFVISPQYEDANEFQKNGLAIVWINGHAGMIDETDRFVIKPIYSLIHPFSEGLAVVYEEGQGYKVFDKTGKILTDKAYPFISSFQEHRAVFQDRSDGSESLYGYLDSSGKIVISPKYEFANDFHDGKALVKLKDRTFALIGLNGEQLQTYPFEEMGMLSEGLLSFKKNYQDKAGYVNESGKIVLPPRYSSAMPFQNERAVVAIAENNNDQYGLIDKTGAFVIPPKYNNIILLGENRASVGKAIDQEKPYIGSVFAIADTTTGRILTDFIYDSVDVFDGEYSSVTKGLNSFFINRNGTRALNLPIINGVGQLSLEGDLIVAFVDGRYSYYDRNGHLVWTQNTVIPLTWTIHIREEKYSPNKDYLVYYPQIEGMKDKIAQLRVNQYLRSSSQVKEIPRNEQLDYSYSGDFSVQFFQKNLLVLGLAGYHYPFGAAHGMPSKINVHIDLKTGQIYRLKDLFKPGSNYVKALSEIIKKKIQEQQDSYIFPDVYKEIKENQPFYVTKDKLVIYFLPYEIAAFAAGFPKFEIPYQDIMSLINVKDAFWRSFH